MRRIAFWLSLAVAFSIPWEVVIEFSSIGTVTRILGLLLAFFWVLAVINSRKMRKPSVFHLAFFIFLLWNAVSIFWSANTISTFEQLATWFQLLILSYILWDLCDTRADLLAWLQAYVLGAYVAIGSTLVNFFSGNTFYIERFSASGTQPDDLGIVLALGIPLAWYLLDPKSGVKMTLILKWINYLYLPAALAGIALSGTRTAIIAAIPGILFSLISLIRHKSYKRAAIILLMALIVFVSIPFIPQASFQRLSTTGAEISGGDLNGRIELWKEGLSSFVKHPWIGIGSNMYRTINIEGKVAHNSFLSVLVETGIIGFILFGIVLSIAVICALNQPKWDATFWIFVFIVWGIGAFTLTWEYKKPTWLFLSLMIVSASIKSYPILTAWQHEQKKFDNGVDSGLSPAIDQQG